MPTDIIGPGRHSRGHVVLACATATGLQAAAAIVAHQPLAGTLPFELLALAIDGTAMVLRWDGVTLVRRKGDAVRPPFSSSSFATAEVIAARGRRFSEMFPASHVPHAAALARYHCEHDQAQGAHSVLMRRPDAATRSICHVCTSTAVATLTYVPVDSAGPQLLPPLISTLDRRPVSWE